MKHKQYKNLKSDMKLTLGVCFNFFFHFRNMKLRPRKFYELTQFNDGRGGTKHRSLTPSSFNYSIALIQHVYVPITRNISMNKKSKYPALIKHIFW